MRAERRIREGGAWVIREIELPIPLWWRLLHNSTPWAWLARLSNRLYEWRYGFWAPGTMDCFISTTLHALNPALAANWAEGSGDRRPRHALYVAPGIAEKFTLRDRPDTLGDPLE